VLSAVLLFTTSEYYKRTLSVDRCARELLAEMNAPAAPSPEEGGVQPAAVEVATAAEAKRLKVKRLKGMLDPNCPAGFPRGP